MDQAMSYFWEYSVILLKRQSGQLNDLLPKMMIELWFAEHLPAPVLC